MAGGSGCVQGHGLVMQTPDPIRAWGAVGMAIVILISILVMQLLFFLIGAGGLNSLDIVVDTVLFSSILTLIITLLKYKKD